MKFGQAHVLTTGALAAFGSVALVSSVLSLRTSGARPAVLAIVGMLLVAQIVAVATRRGAGQDPIVLGLVALHFVAATVLGGGALFAVAAAGVSVVLPAALVLSHLRREVEGNYRQGARDRTGLPVDVPRILRSRRVVGRSFFAAMLGLGAPMVLLTALFFLAFPRLPSSTWVGFAPSIDLHGDGRLEPDPTIALRITPTTTTTTMERRLALRLRGATLDSFDGRSWRESAPPAPFAASRAPDLARDRGLRIVRAGTGRDRPRVFVPDGTIAITDVDDSAWTAWTAPPREAVASPSSARDPRLLALPANVSPRLRALAHAWTDGEPSADAKARAIERHLRAELAYDLSSPARSAADPLEDFVFGSKRGHCELFASAMAVMLREVGVPARIATGYAGATLNRFGGYWVVRESDAHAWIEAATESGFRSFDPTPPAPPAPASPSGLLASAGDLEDAIGHRGMRERFVLAVGGALLVVFVAMQVRFPRVRRRRSDRQASKTVVDPRVADATELYAALDRTLATMGLARDPSTPPLAHAARIARTGHPLATEIQALTTLYLEVRFGGRELSHTTRIDAEERIAALRAAPSI